MFLFPASFHQIYLAKKKAPKVLFMFGKLFLHIVIDVLNVIIVLYFF